MSQECIRTFSSTAEYEQFIQAPDAARRQRNIDEAKRRSQARLRRPRKAFTQKVQRSIEELAQYIESVLTRQDVPDMQGYAEQFSRTVRFVQGGSPGLGRR